VEEQLRRGRLVILEIDVQGAIQIKKKMPEAYSIFILPPDEATLLQRLRDRKRDDEATIQKRFAQAQHEIAAARSCGVYDQFLVNKDLQETIGRAVDLVKAERARRRTAR
jgi:guanylate kinase